MHISDDISGDDHTSNVAMVARRKAKKLLQCSQPCHQGEFGTYVSVHDSNHGIVVRNFVSLSYGEVGGHLVKLVNITAYTSVDLQEAVGRLQRQIR